MQLTALLPVIAVQFTSFYTAQQTILQQQLAVLYVSSQSVLQYLSPSFRQARLFLISLFTTQLRPHSVTNTPSILPPEAAISLKEINNLFKILRRRLLLGTTACKQYLLKKCIFNYCGKTTRKCVCVHSRRYKTICPRHRLVGAVCIYLCLALLNFI